MANALQYSRLENSMDRGAWRAIVHGVAKSWTRLSTMVTQLCGYTKNHQLAYFERMNVMTWEIHLKTKVQLGQTERLNSPQNLLFWCLHPAEKHSTYPSPQAHSLDMAMLTPHPQPPALPCLMLILYIPPSFLSPLGFHQKTQRTFCRGRG